MMTLAMMTLAMMTLAMMTLAMMPLITMTQTNNLTRRDFVLRECVTATHFSTSFALITNAFALATLFASFITTA